MLVSQLGVKAKNFTVKIMTIYYHIKSMEGKFMKPNRRNSLDVRWHRPLERSVICTIVVKKNSPHPLNDPSSEGETLSPSSEIWKKRVHMQDYWGCLQA